MTKQLSVTISASDIIFETGKIARLSHGSVLIKSGDTMVLSAVVVSSESRPGQKFLPLTVDYREKTAAAGKIPGNFFRREARPSEREILVCRLTDRPIRPLFPKKFFNEMIVCQTVFSTDNEHDPGVLSINAASAALHISKAPLKEPIGAVRVGMFDGELVVNPNMSDMDRSRLDLVIAGTAKSVVMVEGSAKEISEDEMVDALDFGHTYIKKICETIEELRKMVGVAKMIIESSEIDSDVQADVESLAVEPMEDILCIAEKTPRQEATSALKTEVLEKLAEKYGEQLFEERLSDIKDTFDAVERHIMRKQVITSSVRVDGRSTDEIRPITIEVGFLPRAHGSCLFTRGETQAVVTATLGTGRDEQKVDDLTGDELRRFFLHYNFPPWPVGEVRRIMGPGRREIGHGKLAERAVSNILPFDPAEGKGEDFPYTIRIVSDITESNGSSSMATVCGATMSLMDAGVHIKSPVAGIAMGMIKEGEDSHILSDILGIEDHLGDMDFKVCGTREGICAFQMDIKIEGISSDLMRKALYQAKTGRMHILDKMNECMSEARSEISPYAPRIYTIVIPVDKIRDVIGPGGKVIREIQSTTGADIDIQDDGTVFVAAIDAESANQALDTIKSLTAEIEVGAIYHGTVTRVMNFGAFVSLIGNKDGLVHISELTVGRVREVTDVVDIGDELDVKVTEIDKMGRVNCSKVQADKELGRLSEEDIKQLDRKPPPRPRQDRNSRDRNRSAPRSDRGDRKYRR